MTEIKRFDTVRNNKNGHLYCVVGLAVNSETLEDMVIYADHNGGIWVRPYSLFLQKFALVSRVEKG